MEPRKQHNRHNVRSIRQIPRASAQVPKRHEELTTRDWLRIPPYRRRISLGRSRVRHRRRCTYFPHPSHPPPFNSTPQLTPPPPGRRLPRPPILRHRREIPLPIPHCGRPPRTYRIRKNPSSLRSSRQSQIPNSQLHQGRAAYSQRRRLLLPLHLP